MLWLHLERLRPMHLVWFSLLPLHLLGKSCSRGGEKIGPSNMSQLVLLALFLVKLL